MCVLGTALPYAMFIPWLLKNGLDLRLLLDQATPPIAAFAWLDVVIAAVVVLVLAIKQIFAGQSRFWFSCRRHMWGGRVLGVATLPLLATQTRTTN
jgi:hypothetical protein